MAAAKLSEPEVGEASGEQPTGTAQVAARGGAAAGQLLSERYRLEALLGRGGMGEVWRAQHLLTGRQVAVKLLRHALAHQPDMRRRFLREARAAAVVNHPNVVEVLDAFEADDGTPALVMPLLEGETLGSLLSREGPLPLATALEVLVPLISAVAAAHERQVIHRDLKPENVFLVREAEHFAVKVLDFGIAKLMVDDESGDSTITGTGTLIGTPCYMAPEQAFGERDQDHRVDIYAIGVVAYETLSGCRPVEGENIGHVVKALLTQATTPLDVVAPQVPQPLAALVMRLLSRDKAQRPQQLGEVLAELSQLQTHAEPAAQGSGAERRAVTTGSTLVSSGDKRAKELPLGFAPTLNATPVEHAVTQRRAQGSGRGPLLALGIVGLLGGAYALSRAGNGEATPNAGSRSAASSLTPLPAPAPLDATAPVTVTSAAAASSSARSAAASVGPAAPASASAAASATPRTGVLAKNPPPRTVASAKRLPTGAAHGDGLQEDPPF